TTGKLPVSRSCVVKSLNNTPLFWRGHLLSGRDSSRVSPFEAWFGLDAEAKLAVLSSCQERFLGQCRDGVPDWRTGVILGEFARTLLRHLCPVLRLISSRANLSRVVGRLFGFTTNLFES